MHRFLLPGVLSLSYVLTMMPVAEAGMRGDVGLLLEVADKLEANREALRFWEGEATVRSSFSREGDEPEEVEVADIAFGFAREPDAVWWTWRPRPNAEGVTRGPSGGLFRGDTAWHDLGLRDSGTQHFIEVERGERGEVFDDAAGFDPRWLFRLDTGDPAERLRWAHENAEELDDRWEVIREGDLVTFRIASPGVLNEMTFDFAQGANVVRDFNEDGSSRSERVQTWERADGLFVPVTMIDRDGPSEGRSGRTHERAVRITASTVNQPIDDGEFSLEQIGARPGDRVQLRGGGSERLGDG